MRDTDLVDRDPDCAARVAAALGALDGGAESVAKLGAALLTRHGEEP